jgi:hypothetical protein
MLAERNWAVAMAIHPDYCSKHGYREAAGNGYFTIQHGMPQLEAPEALRHLFAVRIQSVAAAENEFAALETGIHPIPVIAVSVSDVFEDDFESLLHEYYEASGQNLRAVLTVVQQALMETVGMGEEVITIASLREAALGLAYSPHVHLAARNVVGLSLSGRFEGDTRGRGSGFCLLKGHQSAAHQ